MTTTGPCISKFQKRVTLWSENAAGFVYRLNDAHCKNVYLIAEISLLACPCSSSFALVISQCFCCPLCLQTVIFSVYVLNCPVEKISALCT